MMLKVIGAGFPRTGTTSLKAALERLGFGPCYHMFELMTHPDHVDRWLPVASGTPVDWEHVMAGYQSALDWPASHFWRDQARTYPDAKVILTVRDVHRWYASFRNLITHAVQEPVQGENQESLPSVSDTMTRLRPVLETIGQETFGESWRFGEVFPDEEEAVAAFRRHTETVTESLPAERLLVFDVAQGWEPLCEFLGVEVPDEPFPHLNDSESLQRSIERAMTEGEIPSPFAGT